MDMDAISEKFFAMKDTSANAGKSLMSHVGRHKVKYSLAGMGAAGLLGAGIGGMQHMGHLLSPNSEKEEYATWGTKVGAMKSTIGLGLLGGAGILGYKGVRALSGNKPLTGIPGMFDEAVNKVTGTSARIFKAGANRLDKMSMNQTSIFSDVAGDFAKSQGDKWMEKGLTRTLAGNVGMGLAFGGLTAAFDIALNSPVDERAMAESQQGSAYSGSGGFGTRRSSTIRELGNSTMGLTQGLHRSRHG
jgi:hypothetical protein